MGWSCRADAGNVLRVWTDACIAQTGNQNVYRVNGAEYFWEISRTEHADGAITGTIQRVTEKFDDGRCMVKKSGTFRIEGDGTITRASRFLKDASKR